MRRILQVNSLLILGPLCWKLHCRVEEKEGVHMTLRCRLQASDVGLMRAQAVKNRCGTWLGHTDREINVSESRI